MTDDSHTVQMRFTKEGLCKCFSEMFIRSNARGHSKPPYLTAKIPISCYGRTHSAVIEKSKHSHYKVSTFSLEEKSHFSQTFLLCFLSCG